MANPTLESLVIVLPQQAMANGYGGDFGIDAPASFKRRVTGCLDQTGFAAIVELIFRIRHDRQLCAGPGIVSIRRQEKAGPPHCHARHDQELPEGGRGRSHGRETGRQLCRTGELGDFVGLHESNRSHCAERPAGLPGLARDGPRHD